MNLKTKAKTKAPLPATSIAALALATAVACGDGGAKTAPALVAAADPIGGPRQPLADPGFVGVIVAGESVEVEPRVEARIEEMFVRSGDQIRRGMPIARLDVQSSLHELASARAALQDATRRLGRRVRLGKGRPGAVTAEEMDTARREVLQEQARVAKLREAHADATVKAPFDGAIVERYLSAGALAGPNRPLVRLLGKGEVKVRFAVPEERARDLIVGHELEVCVGVAPEKRLRARLTAINPEIDSSSRMVYAAASFASPPESNTLSTGLMARVFPVPTAATEKSSGK